MARTNPVNLRLDDAEMAALRAAAERDNKPVSTWIREAAVKQATSPEPEPEPIQRMDPMMLLYAGAALAELQRQQRPRWWRFWRRGQVAELAAPAPPRDISREMSELAAAGQVIDAAC